MTISVSDGVIDEEQFICLLLILFFGNKYQF